MTVWGALAGGAVGAVVLASGLRIAQEAGGRGSTCRSCSGRCSPRTAAAPPRSATLLHVANGLVFALVYFAIFDAVGQAGWLFGLALGAVHAAFVAGGLVNVVLPAVHPRMGTPWTDAEETPLLEQPGFLLVNYGRRTAGTTLVLHLAYGAIVGAFAAGL